MEDNPKRNALAAGLVLDYPTGNQGCIRNLNSSVQNFYNLSYLYLSPTGQVVVPVVLTGLKLWPSQLK